MRVGFLVEQLLAPVPGGTGRYSAELAAALARLAEPGDSVAGWCAAHRRFEEAALPGVLGPMRLALPRRALAASWSRGVGPAPRSVDLIHAPTLLVPPAGGTSGQLTRKLSQRLRGEPGRSGGGSGRSGGSPRAAGGRLGAGRPRPPLSAWASATVAPALADALDRRRPRPRLVVTIHDAVPWTHPETLTPHGARWHRQMGERAVRLADAIVVPTLAVAAEVARHLPIPPQRLHAIGEGVAEAVTRVPPDADARAARLGLPPPGGYLLTLATLEPRKGLDTALAALCRPDDPGLPLVHVGATGWGGLDVRTEATRRGLDPARVRTLGRISDEDLAVVLSRAAVLLAPSRSEGFGLPVVEAMAHGVPVVVSDAPALVEVAGDAALVAGVGDAAALAAAVARIVGDPDLRGRLSDAGRARARMFTWNAAAEATWALYRRVSGSPAVSVADDGRA
ncbi:Glycosyltransferase [Frankia canadensis]|uniref:Glycosyltransferase n=1 Tax=Frankia canadensis TaxID=1836972 RepID=A0A2I2L0T4_9ACTN|nr:glycosyltransferase family 1 protein [Frankia canadensis]SNQ51515.1 Glycosyltransferase [Frankia canadensis]SOU58805.1 Glycosyltransferase [Frankia canadensis]